MYHHFPLIILGFVLLAGCRKNPEAPPDGSLPLGGVNKAIYVLNEGNYSDPVGARLTMYDYGHDSVYPNAYESANNGQRLGSTGDDMRLANGKLYVLMSHSNSIHILSVPDNKDLYSRSFVDTIHDIAVDTVYHHVFVTKTFSADHSILVLDDTKLLTVKAIMVGYNPLGMLVLGNYLYVCNSGYGFDSTVSVIDLQTLTVSWTASLSPGPTGIDRSRDGKVIVSCTGSSFTGTPGKVWSIDPLTHARVAAAGFSDYLSGNLVCDTSGNAYVVGVIAGSYFGGPIHKIALNSGAITRNIYSDAVYSLGYNPFTNELVAGNAMSFAQPGQVYILGMDGGVRKSFPSGGLGPGSYAFYWR